VVVRTPAFFVKFVDFGRHRLALANKKHIVAQILDDVRLPVP